MQAKVVSGDETLQVRTEGFGGFTSTNTMREKNITPCLQNIILKILINIPHHFIFKIQFCKNLTTCFTL